MLEALHNFPIEQTDHWAVDALVEACSLLNDNQTEKAHDVIRAALWEAASRCDQYDGVK